MVVIGAAGLLGRRVVARLATGPVPVVAADLVPPRATGPAVTARTVDVAGDPQEALDALVAGAGCVVHLAFSDATEVDEVAAARVNLDGTRRVLAAAGRAGVPHLVVLSSATVYGAWPTNPVPLTEDAPLHPNPEFTYAVHKAQVEGMVAAWARGAPGRTAAVLRPTVALAEDGSSWLARALAEAARLPVGGDDPPAQFVHLDDLAAAVELAVTARLDGPFNVAPDGWIPGDAVRPLAGLPPRPRLPMRVAAPLAEWSWALRRGPIPPGLLAYTQYPWVVANDRLRAAGWVPANTNEEAFVAGTEGSWWTSISPKRKQELALAVSGLSAAAAVAGAAIGVRALRRRR